MRLIPASIERRVPEERLPRIALKVFVVCFYVQVVAAAMLGLAVLASLASH